MLQQGLFKELFEFAEQTYKESLGLGKSLLSVDALMNIAYGLLMINNFEKADEILKQGEELLKTIKNKQSRDYKQREAYIAFLKGTFYSPFSSQDPDLDLALHYFEQSLALQEEHDDKTIIAYSLNNIAAIIGMFKGDLNRGFEYVEKALTLAKETKKKFTIAHILMIMAGLYGFKGDLNRAIELNEQSLEIFKELKNKVMSASLLNNLGGEYRLIGELDRALEYLEKSLEILNEWGTLRDIASIHDFLIQILIEKGDIERAQHYLDQLEQLNNQLKDKGLNILFLLNKALILKNSSRTRDRGRAEDIFKRILEDESTNYEIQISALPNLCDLLLMELQLTGDLEVLDELNQYITQLSDIAEKSGSFLVLGKSYLLKAKSALITYDLEHARRLLAQGQQIAEKYGLNQLAIQISNEHDKMLNQLDMWENLKESKAPLTERIELSRLSEQMKGLMEKRIVKLPKLEVEQPVLLTIMSKEGNILLSNPFTADITIDSTFFSEFLSSCNIFCDQILSESFDRMKFGKHTVLITAVDSLSICYMFEGQSYSARQKLLHFSGSVEKDSEIMKILQDASNQNKEVKVNEIVSLEELIYECFLSDPKQFQMPFKAYEGEEQYVFVSYSHTDRLQVYPIIDYLNKTGINIWYDEGIPISEDWKKSIVENLEGCSAFLVFITPHIIDSEYVRKEISFALKKHKPFFSVYLKETELPSELEFEIGNIQFMKKYLLPEPEFYNKLNRMLDPVLNK
ncbi:MAG: tetratricopeptide repeat protein [Candidatus Hodarchaeota archaeon]